ncbi:hypothetical protein KY290_014778 [Solanum tuberosum]|uniref:Uncharacterized protein n=1 Tax=Solanum tuberosum TaxID=4113 RepID=A0ABQ7VQM2_SOLTU|nr:hypothetical protein KY284_014183 [Solanum tuberosum]KAH0770797.1 hypothetical protein KY290_014778 [Solanum tuberosum]
MSAFEVSDGCRVEFIGLTSCPNIKDAENNISLSDFHQAGLASLLSAEFSTKDNNTSFRDQTEKLLEETKPEPSTLMLNAWTVELILIQFRVMHQTFENASESQNEREKIQKCSK